MAGFNVRRFTKLMDVLNVPFRWFQCTKVHKINGCPKCSFPFAGFNVRRFTKLMDVLVKCSVVLYEEKGIMAGFNVRRFTKLMDVLNVYCTKVHKINGCPKCSPQN